MCKLQITNFIADKPTKCTVSQSWQSKEDKKAWLFNQIEEYLEQFVFDASTLPDITEQVQRLEKNEKDRHRCRAAGCEFSYVLHSGRVRYVNV